MKTRYWLPALILFPLAGCADPADTEVDSPEVTADALVAALPTAEMLEVQYPGYTPQVKDGGTTASKTSASDTAAQASCAYADDSDTSVFYQDGCRVIHYVNGVVRDVMDLIGMALDHEPTHQGGGVYLWGPFSPKEGVVAVFGMQKNEDGSIGYKLDAKRAEDPDSAYLTVLRGRIEEGAGLSENIGNFDISYDNLQQVDPSRDVGGTAEYDYDSLGTQTGVHAELHNILGDDGLRHQGAVDYTVNEDKSGEMWYGYTDDIVLTDTSDSAGEPVQETVRVHDRWLSDGQGRADATITGGDLGDDVGYATECWDGDYLEVYAAANWAGQRGDPAQCVFESPQFP